MTPSTTTRARARALGPAAGALISLLLAACGGGGDAPAPIPTVSSVAVVAGSAMYSQSMVIVVTGTDVDQQLFVTSPSCTGMYQSTAAPYQSTASTAYYRCKVSAVGPSQVTVGRVVDQVVLGSTGFTVAAPQVSMTASDGRNNATMVFTLYPGNAPLTVNNFLDYVNTGFYLGTVFHRVNNTSGVVQGGGYLPLTPGQPALLKTPNPPIPLEVGRGLSNVQWSLAMARGTALNSATSQFFINVLDNRSFDSLNGGYAVFGEVNADASRDAVTFIDTVPCAPFPSIGSECAPTANIVITAATQIQ
jgi:cyclophilin family peptidyl-prolyl cis-trans isomerase